MSTLSKAWYTAWSSLPYLNFGDKFFYREVNGRWRVSENIPELVNIADQILANRLRHKFSIQKFWLNLPSRYRISTYYVHNWIRTLVASNIKELILEVDGSIDSFYILPNEFFAAEGLSVLDLRRFVFQLPPDHGIKFSSLRKLRLTDAYLDEQFVRALCKSCTGLESLRLSSCRGLFSLQITATLQKLKTVRLLCRPEVQMVDIAEPSIENLYIKSYQWDLQVIKITCCKSLKTLYLVNVDVTDGWLKDLFNQPNLKHLYLSSCTEWQTIKMSK